MKTYAFTTLIASIFLLSGCTGEPSEQDIYTAMNKVVEQTNAIVKSIAGKDVLDLPLYFQTPVIT